MEKQRTSLDTLREFLCLPHSSAAVFEKFSQLPGASVEMDEFNTGFLYVPATRPAPVLLVAHADAFGDDNQVPELYENDESIRNPGHVLGADDRAGCAIIWELRRLGHGILITDGEELGCLGAENIVMNYPEFCAELQERHQFMVQFDRQGRSDYKCYDAGTDAFRHYVEQMTGFHEPDRRSRTDVAVLARNICGVNLSCGYQKAHTPSEYILKADWLNTLRIAEQWLSAPELPRFRRS